ncbi:MAG: arylsulfotransferase family protein [Patescibacteria group bacterium]
MSSVRVVIAVGLFFIAGFASDRIIADYCVGSRMGGIVMVSTPGISSGYVLTYPHTGISFFEESGEVNLLDERGHVVHRWTTQHPVLAARLQPSGHLYVSMTPPIDQPAQPGGGTTGLIQELDWEGNVVWEYEDAAMHHEFDVLPDGSVVFIRWDPLPSDFSRRLVGGSGDAKKEAWSDEFVIVNREKKIIWSWHIYQHIELSRYPINPFAPRSDSTHTNSVVYTLDNPLTHTPAILVSVRNISKVFLIDVQSGEMIWESPKDLFSLQHDATFTDAGTILVFDNGLFRLRTRANFWSTVVEINPRTNKVVWEYEGGKTGAEKSKFASSITSGAQRLANGNTLITASMASRIFEVTPDKRIVWQYVNDYRDDESRDRNMFKTRKYSPESTEWKARIPTLIPMLCGAY